MKGREDEEKTGKRGREDDLDERTKRRNDPSALRLRSGTIPLRDRRLWDLFAKGGVQSNPN
jgi:hypothetical protein